MTTLYTVTIHCDNCGEWCEAPPVRSIVGVTSKLVKQLKRDGWSRVTHSVFTDLCPTCLEKSRKGNLNESS